MDNIVTRLRDAVGRCGHDWDLGGEWFPEPTVCTDCIRQNEAADEIERLRSLVRELRPYMEVDMNAGLSVGPGPEYHYHPDDPVKKCPDCEWYEDAASWKSRIESGELDV